MSDISAIWNENLPSDTSLAIRGRTEILDTWKAISVAAGEWLDWPGGGLKAGASRTFFDVSSNVTYASGDDRKLKNRLYLSSDESRLFIFDTDTPQGSQSSMIIGSPMRTEHTGKAEDPTGIQSYWASISGQTLVDNTITSGVFRYTFNGKIDVSAGGDVNRRPEFSEVPTVMISSSNTGDIFAVSSVTTGGFSWNKHELAGTSNGSIYWLATGPIHLTTPIGSQFIRLL